MMEMIDHGNTRTVELPVSYLKRKHCPGCFANTRKAILAMQSTSPAENLPLNKHGKFLSGYANKRVFFSYYRCHECQLFYCPTYFTQEQLDALYGHQNENMLEAPLKARERTQKSYYDLLKKYPLLTGNYLEIGADIGLFAQLFQHETQIDELFLYEPNCEVHAVLKKNVGDKKHQIIVKNYAASDIAPNSLSLAVIIHALDHLLEPRELMAGIYQNLKPGGIALIVTHDQSSLLSKLLKRNWPPYTLQHPQLYKPATLQHLLKAEGFHILGSEKTVNYFPLMHFIKGGLAAIGLNRFPIPAFTKPIIPIKLGNIATIAQKPFGTST